MDRELRVEYFAVLREQRGCAAETVTTAARTPAELYDQLRARHHLDMPRGYLLVGVNGEYGEWDQSLEGGDTVAFLPPVAGG